jgi:phytoene synthase
LHCEQLVRTLDKDSFIATLYAPQERRPWLFALHAFALEIARVRKTVRDPMAGTIRLQWWLEALSELRPEEAAASPVMIALQDASRRAGVALTPLTAAVESRQDELRGEPAIAAKAATFVMAARFLGVAADLAAVAGDAAEAVALATTAPQRAREAYARFRAGVGDLPREALPAFLPVTLVPLLVRRPDAPQWRRQLALVRAAHFGFARL